MNQQRYGGIAPPRERGPTDAEALAGRRENGPSPAEAATAREGGSFPVAEILKPLGFRNIRLRRIFAGVTMLEFLAGKKLPGIEALKK
jgi:hypothetical protein